jgi:hypothetical protein
MAPSVGVNTPVVIPPISSTGVMIGRTACHLNMRSPTNSAMPHNSTVSWAWKPSFTTRNHTSVGQPITTSVSMMALDTRCHSNLMSPPQPFLWAK